MKLMITFLLVLILSAIAFGVETSGAKSVIEASVDSLGIENVEANNISEVQGDISILYGDIIYNKKLRDVDRRSVEDVSYIGLNNDQSVLLSYGKPEKDGSFIRYCKTVGA